MIEEVRKLRNHRPFSPYTVVLADGRQFHVADQFHLGFGGKMVGIYDEAQDQFVHVNQSSVKAVLVDQPIKQTEPGS